MRYLVSVEPAEVADTEVDKWAKKDAPVVPNFPTGAQNTFLSTVDFKPSSHARVVDRKDIDPDDVAARLIAEYPGLPSALHEAYVLATARLARKFNPGTVLQVFITPESARVKVVGGNETIHTLWETQPIKGMN